MTVNKDESGHGVVHIDSAPLVQAPLRDLYNAFCEIPCGTPGFELLTKVIRIVAASLAAVAAFSEASGSNRFTPCMDLDDARQRSFDLLAMLERLNSRKDSGGSSETGGKQENE